MELREFLKERLTEKRGMYNAHLKIFNVSEKMDNLDEERRAEIVRELLIATGELQEIEFIHLNMSSLED